MNPLLSVPPDTFVTDRARTHWIDTNVMLEIYSHGDLYRDYYFGPHGDPERRWRQIQGSLWMAMALCSLRAVGVTYEHENLRNILRLAPPDSEIGGWTSTILHVAGDGGVFEGWDRLMTNGGDGLSDRDRDRLIVRVCAPGPLPTPIPNIPVERSRGIGEALADIRVRLPGPLILITRDADLIDEAQAAGVDAADPETFAMRTMTRAEARAMFGSRLGQAMDRYVARGSLAERALRIRAMDRVRMLHDAGWCPPDDP